VAPTRLKVQATLKLQGMIAEIQRCTPPRRLLDGVFEVS
jgi:hypothetical protein